MKRTLPLLLLALAAQAHAADAPAKPVTVKGKPEDVFVQAKVWAMHLTVSPRAYEKMQPSRGGFGGPGPGAGRQPAPKKDDNPDRKPHGGFGYDFEWVKGDLEIDGTLFPDVGVRFKGSGTYLMSQQVAKRPFKIDLDRHVEGHAFKGVRKLTLNNNAMDPTAAREAMSYAVYRAAGVPAPRTAYAEVYLTVEGKFKKEFLGLYTLVEPIDKAFLKKHFGSSKGLLVKPERVGPLEFLGEDWKVYEERYRPKTDASKKHRKRLIDFVRLVQKGSDAEFKAQIGAYLDVDRFLSFLASTVLLASMDSFIGLNHNWMLYLDPKTEKFVFMPWDLDLSYGAFFPLGTAQQLQDLSIRQPYSGTNKLISRLFEDEKVYAAYKEQLKKLMKSGFTAEGAKKELAAINRVIDPIKEREKKAVAARKENRGGFGMGGPGGNMFANAPAIDTFVAKRIESVQAQLDGKSKGTILRGGFGMGGPGGMNPAAQIARPLMKAADTDKDGKLTKKEALAAAEALLEACGAKKDGEVDQKALAKALEKMLPRPQGGFGFTPPSQAPAVARRVIEKAGKKGKLTLSSLNAAIEKRFDAADRSKDGKLDEAALAEALRDLVPAPAFGGPRGFNPAAAITRPALEAADADIDGVLTKEEMTAAVKALFAACEADRRGEVDQAALTKALDKLLPKPQGFGGFTPASQAPAIARKVVERAGKLGKVTEAGLVAQAEKMFVAADNNKDGKLDEAELGEALRGLMPMMPFGGPGGFNPAVAIVRPALESSDKDVDGKLTLDEVSAGVKALFKLCAADKDGAVDQAALAKALEKVLPRTQGFAFPPMPQAAALAKSVLSQLGKDGKVTEKGLLAEAKKRFGEADRDKDGKLDEEELAEALRELVPAPQFGPPGGRR